MKTEQEIKDKIIRLEEMRTKAYKDDNDGMVCHIDLQIDMMLWVLGEEGGLPPLDEEPIYSCYNGAA